MSSHNVSNERIKREYFTFLKDAKQQSEATIDAVAESLGRFEDYTRNRDFKAFRKEQAIGFKNWLAEQKNKQTGNPLSKATMYGTVSDLKRFFQWLANQSGYKSKIRLTDAEYFNLSDEDVRVATARRERPSPTLDQIKTAIALMPSGSEVELRDRAVVAFVLLTGVRDSALVSMKLKHVDLAASSIYQDARDVKTKFSKTFLIGSDARCRPCLRAQRPEARSLADDNTGPKDLP